MAGSVAEAGSCVAARIAWWRGEWIVSSDETVLNWRRVAVI
jgi:hypothetical protein